MDLEEFVNLLIYKSGLNLGELAEELGVTRQTLSNWRTGKISKIDPDTITKLESAMRRNRWGIKLGSISRSTIEIINTSDQANSAVKTQQPSDSIMQDEIIKHQINYIKNLENQIAVLKEQLVSYQSAKK